MNKIKQVIKSRTFWTIVVMFVINGINGIHNSIPADWVTGIDFILGIAATYFHVNPKQNYNS